MLLCCGLGQRMAFRPHNRRVWHRVLLRGRAILLLRADATQRAGERDEGGECERHRSELMDRVLPPAHLATLAPHPEEAEAG